MIWSDETREERENEERSEGAGSQEAIRTREDTAMRGRKATGYYDNTLGPKRCIRVKRRSGLLSIRRFQKKAERGFECTRFTSTTQEKHFDV